MTDSDNPDEAQQPPDPLVEAMEKHKGQLYWAVKSIARRVEINENGDITLLFIKYTVKVGNEGFKLIGQLKKLESLDATDSSITDAGAVPLAQLQQMRELILDITALGDEGLPPISKLRSLKRLSLSATRVGD